MTVQEGLAWEVFALRYGRSAAYPLADLVAGEEPGVMHPMSWYCWLLRRGRQHVLVDTGFSAEHLRRHWCVEELTPVSELLARLGVAPSEIEDVVLTHGHADHTGNLGAFSRARIWLRAIEFAWIRAALAPLRDLRWGVSLADYETLLLAASEERVTLLGTRDEPLHPGVLLCPGGGHTPGSQWVEIATRVGKLVLASDNSYLQRNIEELRPIGACVSRSQNEAALAAMRRSVGDVRRVVPGHDPLIAARYPEIFPDIFRLDIPLTTEAPN